MDNALSDDYAANLANLAGRTKASASALAGDAKTQVREAATVVARSIEQQPLTALLIGGLVCGAVGFLLARR